MQDVDCEDVFLRKPGKYDRWILRVISTGKFGSALEKNSFVRVSGVAKDSGCLLVTIVPLLFGLSVRKSKKYRVYAVIEKVKGHVSYT